MQTREIARHLAETARHFPLLGPVTADGLLAVIQAELGDAERLDGFRPYGDSGLARAVAPASILHIISGNTPHAGLQSLLRGLLLGSHNRCKIPGDGLPEITRFVSLLPPALAANVEIASELPEAWLTEAEAIVVFGSDETIEHFRTRVRVDQRFVAHGHRVSFGVVFDDPGFKSVADAARDASLFNQQGCLSPHLFYVAPSLAREYAVRLATAMASFEAETPRGAISLGEQRAIAAIRDEYAFRAATDPGTAIWQSESSTAWTVILDSSPAFTPSCLNRTIFIKPLPADEELTKALANVRPYLSTVGIFPATPENAGRISSLAQGVSRICPIGQMQLPPLAWHHDGQPVLAPLVRWIDFEPAR